MFCGQLILVSSNSSLPSLLQLLLLNCCPSLITLILCQMSMYDSYSWSPSPFASLQSIRGVEILRISSADASCFSCQYLCPATSSSWSVKLYAPDWGWKRFPPPLFIVSMVSSPYFKILPLFLSTYFFLMDNIYMSCVRSISCWSLSKSSTASNHFPSLFVWNPLRCWPGFYWLTF